MRSVAREARLVAEPSGAAAVAAAMLGRGGGSADPRRRVAMLSGGNVDLATFARIVSPSQEPLC